MGPILPANRSSAIKTDRQRRTLLGVRPRAMLGRMSLMARLGRFSFVIAWLLTSAWLWPRSRVASLTLLAAGGILWFTLRLRETSGGGADRGAAQVDRGAARLMVTQMLRDLTRVQVAYLSQNFASAKQARSWLKQTLPRGFRGVLDDLARDLEQARQGQPPPSLDLPRRIIALRKRLEPLETALDAAVAARPGQPVARPVVFVITEPGERPDGEELPVVSAAGFDPSKPTLIPQVDVLTLFVHKDGSRQVVGQVAFDVARQRLGARMTCIVGADEMRVYQNEPVADHTELELPLTQLPLGFVIGASEFL